MNVDVTKIKLLHGKILVLREKAKDVTAGGIIIPENIRKQELGQGKVVSIGVGSSSFVKLGDSLLFSKYAGTDLDEDYVVVDPKDVIAVYED